MIATILTRIVLISCLLVSAACSSVGYLTHTAGGHLELMSKRTSITSVLQQNNISAETRLALTNVQQVRSYASNTLGLPDNKSYTHYVELDREYVTWVVFAAPELSLQPVSWCFWIVGCVPYRGYFDQQKAVDFAEQMALQGFEIHIGSVAAYSTLGWFSDPVLSSMLNRGRVATADTIFHELAHQQVYIKDDTDFNEAFASAVARAGVRNWLQDSGELKLLARYEQGLVEKDQIYQQIQQLRQRLRLIYKSSATESDKRARKELAFNEYRDKTSKIISAWEHGDRYRPWALDGINNAKLNAMSTYQELITDFLSLFKACDKAYTKFYHVVASTHKLSKPERRNFLRRAKCMRIDDARVAQ